MARGRVKWGMVGVACAAAATGCWLLIERSRAASVRSECARLASILGLREGDRVADVGAGKGQHALELARLVGPRGHVFATEIDSRRRRRIQSAADKEGLPQVSVVEAGETDTGLERGCCNAILMRGVYHHVTRPAETNASIHQALQPGGRLAIVDFPSGWFLSTFFRVNDVPANRGGHGVLLELVIEELAASGFSLESRIDKWDRRQYCVVFRKQAAS